MISIPLEMYFIYYTFHFQNPELYSESPLQHRERFGYRDYTTPPRVHQQAPMYSYSDDYFYPTPTSTFPPFSEQGSCYEGRDFHRMPLQPSMDPFSNPNQLSPFGREPSFIPSNSFSGQRTSRLLPDSSFVEYRPRYSLGDPVTDREIGYPNSSQFFTRNSSGLSDSVDTASSSSTSLSISSQPSETHYMESLIDIESVKNGTNKRFTVMLRNVPNRYTEADLKRVLDLTIPGKDDYPILQ